MKKLARTFAVLALAAVSMFSLGAVADAGSHSSKKVVYFDYNYTPHFKPTRIFLTANSGPYLKKLKWTNWGSSKTVGRGRFISDCASCGEYENKPVTITFRKLINCKYAPNVQTYKFGQIHVIDPNDKNRFSPWGSSCPSKGWRQYQ